MWSATKLRSRPLPFNAVERKITQKLKFGKCTTVTRHNKMRTGQPSDLCTVAAALPWQEAGGWFLQDKGDDTAASEASQPHQRGGR